MYLELEGKRALVCGASQGLGFAIAEALAAEGCHVGLLARNADKLASHVEAFGKRGLKAQALAADMNDWPSLAIALRRFGTPVDILVNNTGGPPPTTVAKTEPELWRKQFEPMVLNQMRLTEAVVPAMREKKFGRVLSIASTSVVEPIPGLVISGALRSALANWMKALATEVARDGITVNVLLPGSFATDRINSLNAAEAKARSVSISKVVEETSAAIPVGRYGEPKEFASVAAFLASPRASYVTGQMIRIDGGAARAL